jgi:hypothetical protein
MTDNPNDVPETAVRQQGNRFQPGQSGNPAGRPRGARHKTTLAIEALLDGEAEALTRKAVELALEGDTVALRLCLERLAPPRKGRTVAVQLPASLRTAADIADAQAAILGALASGDVSPDEAAEIAKVIDAAGVAIERRDLETRIARLEKGKTP